jgi:tRNA 5-methylaminomethyl-2-thiouridine biosynthesis bifunctional protein
LMHPNIHCHYVNDIQDIQFLNDLWQINDIKAPVCVLANGYKLGQFRQTKGIELIGMRGQMTHIKTIHQEEIIYCAEGHFLPEWNGVHALGASFQNQFQDLVPCELDDEKNMRPWRDFFQHPQFEKVGDWVGIRGVSIDHIPLVGCVPKLDEFNEVFQDWRHHANKVMNSKMPNYPGLFVFAGFGSRGLLTIPLLAKILKNIMTKEPLLFSNHLLQAFSPARFAKKNLSRK